MRYQQPAGATEAPTWGLPRGVVVLIGLAATVVAVAGMKEFASILGPVVLALVLTIAIYPLQTWLRRRGFPAWLAMVIALAVIYSILLGLLAAMVVSVAQLATILPAYQEKFNSLVEQGRELLEARGVGSDEVRKALDIDANRVFSVVSKTLDSTVSVTTAVVLIITLLLFMAVEAMGYGQRFAALKRIRPDIAYTLSTFSSGTRSYLLVSTVFGLIVAIFDAAALWAMGIPLPILWGLLSFITNYIPNIGFVLGMIPPALLGLLEGGPSLMLWVIVAYSVINYVIQSIIQPRFVGNTVDISVTVTVLALAFWGWVLGPLGAFLAVPLTLLVRAVFIDIDPATRWMDCLVSSRPPSQDASQDSAVSGDGATGTGGPTGGR
ncbi:MAG: AI-2E family transporter [Mycobacterium sp.]